MIRILMATYHRPDFLKETLKSLANVFSDATFSKDIQMHIYDNNSGRPITDLLEEFRVQFPHIVVDLVLGERNIGKAKALNSFIPKIDDGDTVCSFDSDLVIQGSFYENLASFFVCGAEIIQNGFALIDLHPSVVVPDQTGNGQHLIEKNWVTCPMNPVENHIESEYGFHIAGGCLFTSGKTYKGVGGYRTNRGLFGGNDGYFLLDASRHTGRPVVVMQNLVVWHPADEDEGYAKWKQTAQDQQRANQRCLSYKGFYD